MQPQVLKAVSAHASQPAAQARLPAIQGLSHVWFAGAWTRYGFHEDGLKAGLQAARGVIERLGLAPAGAGASSPLVEVRR